MTRPEQAATRSPRVGSPDPAAVVARIARACPGFRLDRLRPPGRGGLPVLARSLKCWLVAGTLDDAPAVAKVLIRDQPIWRWYFEREVAIHPRLPAAAGAAALRAVDLAAGVMVLDRAPGRPLATRRRLTHPIQPRLVGDLLERLDQLAAWTEGLALAAAPPPPKVVRALRQRLLEDPSAPQRWFIDGIRRCQTLAILPAAGAERMITALADYPEIAPCHGDLLPRNIMVDGDAITLVDWECAGSHARDWDRALLWASLDPSQRSRVDAAVGRDDPARWAAYRALVGFALAREIKFARGRETTRDALVASLTEVVRDLAATTTHGVGGA